MTSEELLDVWSLNFSQMWFRIWLSYDYTNTNYDKKARKFHNTFIKHDRGVRLRAMIEQLAPSGTLIYEFPKGKKNDQKEPNLTCAMRELSEEAGVSRRSYRIVSGFSKVHSFVHMNVQYEVVYYLALLKRPTLFRHVQTVGIANGEVSSAHWMAIEQIAIVDNARGTLQRIVRPAFNYLRKYIKGKPQHGIGALEDRITRLRITTRSDERGNAAAEQADRGDP
jgi:8-oxo-dGTP pyrophosphatase MutT (NUDIX family)